MDFRPYQEVAARFPEITVSAFQSAVHLVDDDGPVRQIYRGAEAVLRTLAAGVAGTTGGVRGLGLKLYQASPLFKVISEKSYALVAKNRKLFSWLTYLFMGEDITVPRYRLVRKYFFKGLGVVGLAALGSLIWQMPSLVGTNGLLPTTSDAALYWTAAIGISASLILALSTGVTAITPWAVAIFFATYFALTQWGQVFLGYQWEALTLDTLFIAFFFAFGRGQGWGLFGLRALLFRLMLGSGLSKIHSGDPAWTSLEALRFHFETQPLPTPLAWFAHQLSPSVLRAITGGVLSIELGAPWLIFGPRRIRQIAFGLLAGFQLLIAATGNYAHFNWLTLLLSFTVLDDQTLLAWFPWISERHSKRSKKAPEVKGAVSATTLLLRGVEPETPSKVWKWVGNGFIMASTVVGLGALTGERLGGFGEIARSFGVGSPYGLFAVMTRTRDEIVLEGSEDGVTWVEYPFRAKPGRLDQVLGSGWGWVAPHQPRLDWQMWFASFTSERSNPWLKVLMKQLLDKNPSAMRLLSDDPFPGKQPKTIRAQFYRYHFTSWSEWRETGHRWKRVKIGTYSTL